MSNGDKNEVQQLGVLDTLRNGKTRDAKEDKNFVTKLV